MKFIRITAVLLTFSAFAVSQTASHIGQTILVVPFENHSKAPGLEWIGDSFPEILQERLDSPTLYVLPREDRIRSYDRLGIPVELRPSRATIYRLAEQLDVDFVVLGQYQFDGRTFGASAQLLDMRRQHLLPQAAESGPLTQLIELQTAMAWDLLRTLNPGTSLSREAYLSQAAPVRLDAFEHYIKGIVAPTPDKQIQHFRDALRLNPSYPEAQLQLGKACYRDHQYDQALSALNSVPEGPLSNEANFYIGLAAYSRNDYLQSEAAFSRVAARLPLTEIYNNLGVTANHRDRKTAIEYFQKAINSDPSDADYHFNLAIALYRSGDVAGANRNLQDAVSLNPADAEARSFLNALSGGQHGVVPASLKVPAERLQTSYDESSFRQLSLKLAAAAEQRLSKVDSRAHAQFHTDRGRQLLKQGFMSDAEREFREAVSLDPINADAHAGLASALLETGNPSECRAEAEQALKLRQFAEPLLVLAQLDLKDNKIDSASQEVDRALRLEPTNTGAQTLKRSVAAKLAQEGQPLPNP